MKRITILLALLLAVAMVVPAAAEVEEITAGGNILIRGQMQTPGPAYEDDALWFNDDYANLEWITQRTRVNLDAKLSGGVRGFVELQAYDYWGFEGWREWSAETDATDLLLDSYPDTFQMFAGQGNEVVTLYQAYIEMNDIADNPLRLRIGRQEMSFGREWLVGNNDSGVNFGGLAFDAIRLTYDTEDVTVDLWTAKLFDWSSPLQIDWNGVEQDGDLDFHGLYATYKGLEDITIDGYFLWVRTNTARYDGFLFSEHSSDTLNLFTAGGRVAGGMELAGGLFDYNLEAAFQFGDNSLVIGDGGDYKGMAFNAMAGFTFTGVQYSPRVEAEYAYFSGPDELFDEDMETFVRLFSDVHYGQINLGQNMDLKANNLHILRLGASAHPCEKSTVSLDVYGFWLAEDDTDSMAPTFGIPQWGADGPSDLDDQVGWELDLAVDYQYTEDLLLTAGWAHFFVDEALENSWGDGYADDDIDYLYVQAALTF